MANKKSHVFRVLALLGMTTLGGASAVQADDSPRRQVIVRGEGEVLRKPDQVGFTIGIEVQDPKLEQARSKADEAMRRLIQVTKDYKVEARDVQSDYMQVQPMIDHSFGNGQGRTPKIIGYSVRRDVRILWRDLPRYDPFVGALFQLGLNQLYNLQFGSSQESKMEEEARAAALKDAKAKAEMMAQGLGLKLGKARSIAEGSVDIGPGPMPMVAMAMAKGMERSSDSTGPTLAPGEVKVRRDVTVVFDAE
jgi:uncharacterized protein YggE